MTVARRLRIMLHKPHIHRDHRLPETAEGDEYLHDEIRESE